MTRRRRRVVLRTVAVACLLGAAAIGAHVGWYEHSARATAATLVHQAERRSGRAAQVAAATARPCVARPPSSPAAGRVRAVLSVPALGLTAPVMQGVSDDALDAGVGHVSASSWPDRGGTVVLAAHDVTFFTHVDRLRTGDRLVVTAPCRSWVYRVRSGRVVRQGTAIPDSPVPTLVLVTCWPTTALFYTDHRYVVTATLAAAGTAGRVLPASTDAALPAVRPALPRGSDPRTLTATAGGVPMGSLHTDPRLAARWRQSGRQLQAVDAATAVFVAATRAVRGGQTSAWRTVAPGQPLPADPLGRWSYAAPVQVDVRGSGVTLTGVVLRTVVTGRGRTTPLTVVMSRNAGILSIRSWRWGRG